MSVFGSMTRQARSQVFTEAMFHDTDQPDVVLGFGTADWAVIDSTPSRFEYIDPGPGVAEDGGLPALASAYDAHPRDGGGFVIDELTPRLGGFVLHHGPILVSLEAAAVEVAGNGARVEELSVRIVKAGRHGPFIATARILSEDTDVQLVRADLHQGSDRGNLIATATVRLRKIP
jgi:hypothetical protein